MQIRRTPKPVVAMVAGYAIGGGHVLHVVCDLTIAAENARFGQTGPRVGSFDGGYGASILAAQIGQKRAKEIWMLCRQYDAEQALEWGLVNAVVPLDGSRRETVGWCREMLALSPFALRLVKASFNATEDGFAGLQQLAHDANLLFYGTEEAREGRTAFAEKRRPDFSRSRDRAVRIWFMAARPRTLPAAVAPVLVGTALAIHNGPFHPLAFVAALLGAILIQIGTNLSNDYSDARRGADTDDRIGPVRVTAGGLAAAAPGARRHLPDVRRCRALRRLPDRRRRLAPAGGRRRLDPRRRALHRRPAAVRLRGARRGLRLPVLRHRRGRRLLLRPAQARCRGRRSCWRCRSGC